MITITGEIERVTFFSPQTLYGVIKLVGYKYVVVGQMPTPMKGVNVECVGQLEENKKFGQQFKLKTIKITAPATKATLRSFLINNVKGVGRVLATRITDMITDDEAANFATMGAPSRLDQIPGFTAAIRADIARQLGGLRLHEFFLEHNINAKFGALLARRFGLDAADMIRENPYLMLRERFVDEETEREITIPFKVADAIGIKFGLGQSPRRIEAAILYTFATTITENGDTAVHEATLLVESEKLLGAEPVARERIDEIYEEMIEAGGLIRLDLERFGEAGRYVQSREMYDIEGTIARFVAEKYATENVMPDIIIDSIDLGTEEEPNPYELAPGRRICGELLRDDGALLHKSAQNDYFDTSSSDSDVKDAWVYDKARDENETTEERIQFEAQRFSLKLAKIKNLLMNIDSDDTGTFAGIIDDHFAGLDEQQVAALKTALLNNLTIISGSPGTGKTYILCRLLRFLDLFGVSYKLASPTGKAALTLRNVTKCENTSTVHRWLYGTYDFPKSFEYLIIDEATMVDTYLMDAALHAIRPYTRVILVGDFSQLASVGPGAVFGDIIATKAAPAIFLHKNYRQKESGDILTVFTDVCAGISPARELDGSKVFKYYDCPPEDFFGTLRTLLTAAISSGRYRFADIAIICPKNDGAISKNSINQFVQKTYNSAAPFVERVALSPTEPRVFRVGDRVMQMKNNYARNCKEGIFNGQLGTIAAANAEAGFIEVQFDDTPAIETYKTNEFGELDLAYSMTVHKSQGSEFKIVFVAVFAEHFNLLVRQNLYTALSRARNKCLLIGDRRSIDAATGNLAERLTYLQYRIHSAAGHGCGDQ